MPLLRREGLFVVPVPDGWEVRAEPGDAYVVVPADARGRDEIRLAVFGREPAPFGEREGADLLLQLLAELGVEPDGEEIAFRARYGRDAQRAFAWFPAYDADGHDADCMAAVVVLPAGVVACTAMASPRRPAILSAAETLVASMTPDIPSRRSRTEMFRRNRRGGGALGADD